MMNNDYNKNLKNFARDLRKNGTKAEIRLWTKLLRDRQMLGFPFLRQRPILNYIADFFNKDLGLVIEVDGFTHQSELTTLKDESKDFDLINAGYSILRFRDEEIMTDIENVRRSIEDKINELAIKKGKVISLPPSKKGEADA